MTGGAWGWWRGGRDGGEARGMLEGGAVWAIEGRAAGGVRSLPLTPHLTSPLVGGGMNWGRGGGGCWFGEAPGALTARVPACAGMTEGARV